MKSDWKKSEGKAGSFKHTAGSWSGDPDDKGNISHVKCSVHFGSFRCRYASESLHS